MSFRPFLPFAAALLIAGCGHVSAPSGPTATAVLSPTTGNTATGTIYFLQQGDRVLVSGEVRGLKPNGEHGFHIHEKGDCSGGDGMAAGGHFNPDKQAHGRYDAAKHHAGDLPSLRADAAGVAAVNFETRSLRITGHDDIVGRGLIVHRDPDDFTTQPTGNSGPRLACAVIRRT